MHRKFDRLLVWRASRLGCDMREVVTAGCELADLGVTVVSLKSQTDPIISTLGKLLWAIRAAQAQAQAAGKRIGRPNAVFRRDLVADLRRRDLSWRKIARELSAGVGTRQ